MKSASGRLKATKPRTSKRNDVQDYYKELSEEFPFQGYTDADEKRGVTLRHIKSVFEFAKLHCHRWVAKTGFLSKSKVTFDHANHYHLSEWVIKPATKPRNCSFKELLSGQSQRPQWFVSHAWSDGLASWMDCLERHAVARALGEDSPLWVALFSLRQHGSEPKLGKKLSDSPLVRSVQAAEGMLLILGDRTASHGDPVALSRMWCMLEVAMACAPSGQKAMGDGSLLLDFAVCVAHHHGVSQVELITDGLTKQEQHAEATCRGAGSQAQAAREQTFPIECLEAGLDVELEECLVTEVQDRGMILNGVAGQSAERREVLVAEDPSYATISRTLQSLFASLAFPHCIEEGLNKVRELDLMPTLAADERRTALKLNLSSSSISDEGLQELTKGLPKQLETLDLAFCACTHITWQGMGALGRSLPKRLKVLALNFACCRELAKDFLPGLAGIIPRQLLEFSLVMDGCEQVANAALTKVAQALPGQLARLSLSFAGCKDLSSAVVTLGRELPEKLKALMLNFSGCEQVGSDAIIQIGRHMPRDCELLKLRFQRCYQIGIQDVAVVVQRLPDRLKELELNFLDTEVSSKRQIIKLEQARAWQKELRRKKAELLRSPSMKFTALKAETNKQVLDLRGESFRDEELVRLSAAMPKSLKELIFDFAGCEGVGDKGITAIANALPPGLLTLRLSLTHCKRISDIGLCDVVECLPHNLTELSLNLKDCSDVSSAISDESVAALGAHLPETLTCLRLNMERCPGVGDEGIAAIARKLPDSLKMLKVDFSFYTDVSDAGLQALGSALPNEITALTTNFQGCKKISDAGIISLAAGLPENLKSLALDLGSTDVKKLKKDSCFEALAKTIPANLEELNLSFADCEMVDDELFARLFRGVPTLLTSLQINFTSCKIGNAAMEALRSRIQPPVRVTIVSAKALRKADSWGKSDPFCICEISSRPELTFQTKVIDATLDPQWDHLQELPGLSRNETLTFTVKDKDITGADLLGTASLAAPDWSSPEGFDGELVLKDPKSKAGAALARLTVKVELFESRMSSLRVDCDNCVMINDTGLQVLGGCLPRCLTELTCSFAGCKEISNAGAMGLFASLPRGLQRSVADFTGTSVSEQFKRAKLQKAKSTRAQKQRKKKHQEKQKNKGDASQESGSDAPSKRPGTPFPRGDGFDSDADSGDGTNTPRRLAPVPKPYQPDAAEEAMLHEFAYWAVNNFEKLHELFELGETDESCPTVSQEVFIKHVESHGFTGNAKIVFRAIQHEGPPTENISLSKLRRFEQRKTMVDVAVAAMQGGTEGERFAKLLRYQYGSVLRAFRLLLDLDGQGDCDFPEFRRACKRIGLDDRRIRLVWLSFRPSASAGAKPLTLKDISPDEADFIGEFASFIEAKFGSFDLDKLWRCIDISRRGSVTINEFIKGLQKLGYEGASRESASQAEGVSQVRGSRHKRASQERGFGPTGNLQMIFRGLDTAGLGRLWPHDLAYLEVQKKKNPKRMQGLSYRKRGKSLVFRPTIRPLLRSATEANVSIKNRPTWDGTVDMTWRKNLEHQAHNRHYFSDLCTKPVKAEIQAKLEGRIEEMEEIKRKVKEQRALMRQQRQQRRGAMDR